MTYVKSGCIICIYLGKKYKTCIRAIKLLKDTYMNRRLLTLLIITLISIGLFADTPVTSTDQATIKIASTVEPFVLFGVSAEEVMGNEAYSSYANFNNAFSSTITVDKPMLSFEEAVVVGYVAAINNTRTQMTLIITTSDLTNGTDTVPLGIAGNSQRTIPKASKNELGVLRTGPISVKAWNGRAAKAPAGTYTATVTISLVTGS